MGIVHSVVADINFDSLKMNHPTPSTIVQPVTGGDVLWYVLYRFLMAIYIVGTFIQGLVSFALYDKDSMNFLHFPVWGYAIANVYAVLLAYCTLDNYYRVYKSMSESGPKHNDRRRRSTSQGNRRRRKTTFNISLPKMPAIYIVIWIAYYIVLYTSFMTLIMYATKLFKGRLLNVVPRSYIRTPGEVILHQAFFIYSFIDFCICGIPMRLLHVYVMAVFAIVYQLVILTVTMSNSSSNENYRPLYDMADFQASRVIICAVYFVGFAFVTPVAVHIIYYGLFLLKTYLAELYIRTTYTMAKPRFQSMGYIATPEEKGASGVPERVSGTARSKILPISEEETEISSFTNV